MSSSPPPLVPCVTSREPLSSPSSSKIHGSPDAARVSYNMHQTPGGRQFDRGPDSPPDSIQIEPFSKQERARGGRAHVMQGIFGAQNFEIIEESAGREVPVADSTSFVSASAQSQRSAALAASLNPFAREFVPGAAPGNEVFIASMDSAELAATSKDGSERVSGLVSEGKEKEPVKFSQGKGVRKLGGLTTVLQQGQPGQGRTGSVLKGGQGGADGNCNLAGPGKRGQFVSANHLLNFQYDPIVRPPPAHRVSFPRKSQKSQPFNKELFLQANYRFLVSDFGDYLLNSLDPDKMLQWEDIAAVSVSAPVPIQCPICLQSPPVCPQITSCGHIFCFPCILRYFVMGENEQRSEFFKKCPLCFAITSSKALRTVFVETVHNYQVGDMIELTLLNRLKGSIIPFEKSEGVVGSIPYSKDGRFHPFSKITLTSDADQTTNKAIAELSTWAERAQNEVDEDMDLIPFALLGVEHLQQRRSAWNDHRASEFLSSSPPVRQRILAQTKEGSSHSLSHGANSLDADSESLKSSKQGSQGKERLDVSCETAAAMADLKGRAGWVYESAFSDDEESGLPQTRHNRTNDNPSESVQTLGLSSSWENNIHDKTSVFEKVVSKDIPQASKREDDDDECYAFFQCADGQPLIMHPLNMKCLLQHYGSYENLPSRLHVRTIEMEGQTQTEALRKRYRYLSHLPLTTNFWFCEVDLRGLLPSSAFIPFNDELRFRETRRRRRQKQEQAEKLREERLSATHNRNSPPAISLPLIEDHNEDMPLLISGSPAENNLDSNGSTPLPTGQRKLFSQVTRLGFASAHDAPDLTPTKSGESSVPLQEKPSSSAWNGVSAKLSTTSFADIIQAQPLKVASPVTRGVDAPSQQSSSKKNKKASKILLSTAGGRRY